MRGMIVMLLGTLVLAACPEGDGKILAEVPLSGLGLASTCHIPCATVADCPPVPSGLGLTYSWLCVESRCVSVECTSDADCTDPDKPTAAQGNSCLGNVCTTTCTADVDCFAIGADQCGADGICIPRLPNTPEPPCDDNADCADSIFCAGLGAGGGPCVCNERGRCQSQATYDSQHCAAPADCIQTGLGGGDPADILFDADNWLCENTRCFWRGCNNNGECQAVEPSSTCETNTGFCHQGCANDSDCLWGAFNIEYAAPFGFTPAPQCIAGSCVMTDVCTSDADCVATRGGLCQRASVDASGYCVYETRPLCFADSDCYSWEKCRWNECSYYATDADPGAAGRVCEASADCQQLHFAQAFLNQPGTAFGGIGGPSINIYSNCDACFDSSECGPDAECVDVAMGSSYDRLQIQPRSVCLPSECTATGGCGSSLAACGADSECPSGEACVWPMSTCAGVCLDLECASCNTWLTTNSKHECLPPAVDINIQIVRPD